MRANQRKGRQPALLAVPPPGTSGVPRFGDPPSTCPVPAQPLPSPCLPYPVPKNLAAHLKAVAQQPACHSHIIGPVGQGKHAWPGAAFQGVPPSPCRECLPPEQALPKPRFHALQPPAHCAGAVSRRPRVGPSMGAHETKQRRRPHSRQHWFARHAHCQTVIPNQTLVFAHRGP